MQNKGKEAGENITKDKIIAQLIHKYELLFLIGFLLLESLLGFDMILFCFRYKKNFKPYFI